MSEWKEYTLEDLAEIFNHKRIPLSSMQRSKRRGTFPYYGASGVIDFVDDYIFDGEHVLISEDGENLKSRQTPIAFIADGKFWVNNHAHIIKGKKEYFNRLIVYYFENLDLNPFLTGAVQPKLNKAALTSIPIYLPESESEQKAIVEVLSSLDDKIDLLHRQNKTLEQLAETLFRQWFVENANESWSEKSLHEIADHYKENIHPFKFPNKYFHHFSLPAFDDGKYPKAELGSEILSNKYKVIPYSILISKLNPRFPRIWELFGNDIPENSICSTEFQVVKPKELKYFAFIYYYLKSNEVTQELASAAGGTSGSHQRVSPDDIFNLSFLMPPIDLIEKFDSITKEQLGKIKSNTLQIQTLTKLRDTLLPKLMNGEVRINLGDSRLTNPSKNKKANVRQ